VVVGRGDGSVILLLLGAGLVVEQQGDEEASQQW
jgi:hypothetical protein